MRRLNGLQLRLSQTPMCPAICRGAAVCCICMLPIVPALIA
jgi:hypothetical protein